MAELIRGDNRWELYRVLSEPLRLRLLAISALEELTIGEMAELTGENQPNISRHLAALRRLGLLAERRQGTRVMVRLADEARGDAVVSDALAAGRSLCERDGMLERIASLIKRRDAPMREFFAKALDGADDAAKARPGEFAAYLMAVAPLIERRDLAVDIGTGDGGLIEVLAPLFRKVIAVDREPARLEFARQRARQSGYSNVELMSGDLISDDVRKAVEQDGFADAVFASRVLHHTPKPLESMQRLAALAKPGGAVIVLDYAAHDDDSMRDEQADVWLGFSAEELERLAWQAGLVDTHLQSIPQAFRGNGPDRHLVWQVFSARRSTAATRRQTKTENGHG